MRILICFLLAASFHQACQCRPFQQYTARQYAVTDDAAPNEVLAAPGSTREWEGSETGPLRSMKVMAAEPNGSLWMGSAEGAVRFDPNAEHRWDRWRYFGGPRWLQDDRVDNILVESLEDRTRIWIRTGKGITRLLRQPQTLNAKARAFEDRIEARHVRHGFVADSRLKNAGDLDSNFPFSNDNDGLWTAMYLGAQAYRYAVTESSDARRKARRALKAVMRLESITGVPGFYARSFISKDEPKPGDGEWHETPDGQWLWKGDTSSDESVGHYYAYSLYFDLVAGDSEKREIARVVSRMTDYLIANDYDLIDLDGKPTRWGQWSTRYFETEEGRYERALRSLELLSFLKTTWHITGDAKYQKAYEDRVRLGYAGMTREYRRWPGGGEINFSDDELAYLSYYPLLKYETNEDLRAIYLDSLRFTWSRIQSDKNPLWNYISAAGGAGPMTDRLLDDSLRTLERIPMDLRYWAVRNSHRLDVQFKDEPGRFGRRQLTAVLPPDERPMAKWNRNPYYADRNDSAHSEDDGVFFLLPYWMGRYYGWVEEDGELSYSRP